MTCSYFKGDASNGAVDRIRVAFAPTGGNTFTVDSIVTRNIRNSQLVSTRNIGRLVVGRSVFETDENVEAYRIDPSQSASISISYRVENHPKNCVVQVSRNIDLYILRNEKLAQRGYETGWESFRDAIQKGDVPAVAIFIEGGIFDIDSVFTPIANWTNSYYTPLWFAMSTGRYNVARYLIYSGASLDVTAAQPPNTETIGHIIETWGQFANVKLILDDYRNSKRRRPIVTAGIPE
jgi:hypothetical protein